MARSAVVSGEGHRSEDTDLKVFTGNLRPCTFLYCGHNHIYRHESIGVMTRGLNIITSVQLFSQLSSIILEELVPSLYLHVFRLECLPSRL